MDGTQFPSYTLLSSQKTPTEYTTNSYHKEIITPGHTLLLIPLARFSPLIPVLRVSTLTPDLLSHDVLTSDLMSPESSVLYLMHQSSGSLETTTYTISGIFSIHAATVRALILREMSSVFCKRHPSARQSEIIRTFGSKVESEKKSKNIIK